MLLVRGFQDNMNYWLIIANNASLVMPNSWNACNLHCAALHSGPETCNLASLLP